MFNPLLSDTSNLKDSELEQRILDLGKKYSIAARFGQGKVCDQIMVILDQLKLEQEKRRIASLKGAHEQGKNLDDLINIG